MIQELFTVFDSKALFYMAPFTAHNKAEAIRMFGDTCNEPGHQFNKHAEDFTLFYLGRFDNQKAFFDIENTPVSLGVAQEFINPPFDVNPLGQAEINNSPEE